YMIFKNMEQLKVSSVRNVVKVGDTVSDIKEGLAAGVLTVGVIEGSSIMALSQEEYKALAENEKTAICNQIADIYKEAGADHVIRNLSELPAWIQQLS
ncbi:MAG: phosphonoacetaldehyde hydrolase, partial [Clostridiales bacterium]|nr:phosphonoacetaldehyde hydrolase [Clostridiales bacterium]